MTGPGSQIHQPAQSVRTLVNEAGGILLQANDEAGKGTFGVKQWAKSANRLLNTALTAALEFTPMLLPSPCLLQLSEGPDFSDFIETTPDDTCDRVLSVAKSFVHVGASAYAIPDQFIVFSPDILPKYANRFRVAANLPDLRCGTYRGRVRLTQIQTGAKPVDEMDVIVDL
jgi:hypothetical protein